MSTVRVTFMQVFCKDDTTGLGTDEIYMLAVPMLVRKAGDKWEKREIQGAITRVKHKIKNKTRYQPELVSGGNSFEIHVDEGTRYLMLCLFMFEEDDGKHYKALKENPTFENAGLPRTDWGEISDYIPTDIKSVRGWLKSAYKLALKAVQFITQDDLVGKSVLNLDLEALDNFGYRQFRFDGNGGVYDLTMLIERA